MSDRVLIVGNGPVGQTLSLLLARWGIASTVFDCRPERDLIGSRAICQHCDVLDIWEAVGAGHQIADEGITWSTARTYYRDAQLFSLTLPDSGSSRFPPFVNISQSRTEEILAKRMAECPLIAQLWAHDVRCIEQTDDSVRVEGAGPSGPFEVSAPWVVLAAGGHAGALRRQLGIEFPGRSYDDRFLICDIRAHLPGWEQERRFYFDPVWNPGRQVLIHPCPGGTFRIDWQVPPDFDLEAEKKDGGLDRRIRAILGSEASYEIIWHSLYRFQGRCATRMRAGRVLLAGDCAHLFSPFGARGLNSGVHDAENAAWKLAFVIKGWAPSELLESYDQERHAAARENLEVTETTMRFLVPQNESDRRHRLEVLERALGDPDGHLEVDSGRLFEPFWYTDSPLTTPDSSRPSPDRPKRGELVACAPGALLLDLPVCDPSDPNGGAISLRSLARDGLLLLCNGAIEPKLLEALARRSTSAPFRALSMSSLSAAESMTEPRVEAEREEAHVQNGASGVADILGARRGELWLVRPDAHVAAIVSEAKEDTELEDLAAAIDRVLDAS